MNARRLLTVFANLAAGNAILWLSAAPSTFDPIVHIVFSAVALLLLAAAFRAPAFPPPVVSLLVSTMTPVFGCAVLVFTACEAAASDLAQVAFCGAVTPPGLLWGVFLTLRDAHLCVPMFWLNWALFAWFLTPPGGNSP